jgi:hypothetical protein
MTKLINFLHENFKDGVQMFNTRNTVGDFTYTVFHEGDIIVDYAPDYGYIEIFGLSQSEFDAISNLYDGEPLWDMLPLPEVE